MAQSIHPTGSLCKAAGFAGTLIAVSTHRLDAYRHRLTLLKTGDYVQRHRLQLSPAWKQLRIPDSKIETSDSISKISVAKFKIGVAKFNILDSAVEDIGG
jgi:hypothetical protein